MNAEQRASIKGAWSTFIDTKDTLDISTALLREKIDQVQEINKQISPLASILVSSTNMDEIRQTTTRINEIAQLRDERLKEQASIEGTLDSKRRDFNAASDQLRSLLDQLPRLSTPSRKITHQFNNHSLTYLDSP